MLDLLAQIDVHKTAFWLPKDISVHGHTIDSLINYTHVFMAILFVGWGIFFAYCLLRFRARPGHKASNVEIKAIPSKVAEVAVIVVEVILLLFISMPAWASYRNDPPPEKDRVEIRVVAAQFQWNLHYPGPDGKFGPRAAQFVNRLDNPIGLDRSNLDSKDDIVGMNNLAIPVGKDIYIRLTSMDVIHSFAIPVLRVKQDAVPGMLIPIWFKATETGEYDIQCAQLCGNNHFKMKGRILIKSQADYEAWLKEQGKGEEVFEE